MNLVYNNGRFEARFSRDFQGDLDAVKTAGFKPDTSSGAWVWHTAKIPVLEKLRKNRPASGIAIDDATFEKYKELKEQFDKNEEIKKAAKAFEKERKAAEKEADYTPGEDGDLFDADGNLLLVWTIWKRSAEREGDWQAVLGSQGDKMTALRRLEDCERLVSDERYQYMAMPGDERPKQTLRGANQAPRGLRGGF
jgi:hypothetical protein